MKMFIGTEILSVDGGNLKLRTRLHGLFTDPGIFSASYYKIHFQIISQSMTATSKKYIPFGLSYCTLRSFATFPVPCSYLTLFGSLNLITTIFYVTYKL